MQRVTPDLIKSVERLKDNPDFQVFMAWIEDQRSDVVEQLMSTVNAVLVHQQQGRLATLADILRAATLSTRAL